jgi:sigma-E factor negative regulatory protein RseB
MRWAAWLLAGMAGGSLAAEPLPQQEAAAWLQQMADAARRLSYEGVFVFQHGDAMQTLHVENRPAGPLKDSHLVAMDGKPREVRCQQGESISVISEGGSVRAERRIGNRHFPDLLPVNAAPLASWYTVTLGPGERVGGLDCRRVELTPRDTYRWGYVLCAENKTRLPLKAVMVNESGKVLLQYSFAEVRIGNSLPASRMNKSIPAAVETIKPSTREVVAVRQLPPGFARVAALKRKMPNKAGEVDHWIYSDGLSHISLFIEPAPRPVETVKGVTPRGMMNLLTRQVGGWQVTVLGDAPWPAVEYVAMHLVERPHD